MDYFSWFFRSKLVNPQVNDSFWRLQSFLENQFTVISIKSKNEAFLSNGNGNDFVILNA